MFKVVKQIKFSFQSKTIWKLKDSFQIVDEINSYVIMPCLSVHHCAQIQILLAEFYKEQFFT